MNSYCSKIAAAAVGVLMGTAAIGPVRAQDYQPGVVLVKTATGTKGRAATAAITQLGSSIVRQLDVPGWKVLKLGANENVASALVRLRRTGGVLVAEPNYIVHPFKTPNDSRYSELYGLAKINAPTAWDIGQGNDEIVVGVLDTGVAYNHEDLKDNMWRNPGEVPNNGIDDDKNGWADDVFGLDAYGQDGNPNDEEGHGTHVAGTIGARGNNGIGVTGVNWRVKIMALRGLGPEGGSVLNIVDAMEYALDMKARGVNLRVINHSYGNLFYSSLEEEVFQKAALAGIVNVVAAGNGDLDGIGDDNDRFPTYPANYDVAGLISVAASNSNDQESTFTNFGAKTVDIAAPGVNILSTFIGSQTKYHYESGTSMASPCVAGAAALLLSRSPQLSPEDVRAQLLKSVDVQDEWKGRVVSNGRLNLAKLFANNVYVVHGKVTVNNANAPAIAGASVFVDGATKAAAVTDENGIYKIGGLTSGKHTFKVSLKGWTFAPAEASVTLAVKTPTSRLDFKGTASTPQYIISGRITREGKTGALPVPAAFIYLDNATEPVAVTDADGRYKIRHRSAGKYIVRAEKVDYSILTAPSSDSEAVVTLPVSAQTPNATVNFRAFLVDTKGPLVAVSRPLYNEDIRQGFPVNVEYRANDDTGVRYVIFYLQNEFGLLYDWRLGQFGFPANPYNVITPKRVAKVVDGSFTISNLPVGNYTLYAGGIDHLGNSTTSDTVTPFSVVTSVGTPETWPFVAITSPTSGANVPAGKAVTVKGTFTSEEYLESIFLRVLRFDEYGNVLGAYDWSTGKFISDTTRFSTYKKIIKGGTSGTWQYVLPSLPAGSYAVNAFGRTVGGKEPPAGRTDDSRVRFTYGGTTTSAKSMASSAKSF